MSDMKLSERVRPDCEAAPWVIEEIKQLEAELARLRAGQEPASRAHIMDALLMWNRRHEAPPIKVGYEYGVAEAVIDLIGTTPQPSAVPAGWKLVPDQATPEMVLASRRIWPDGEAFTRERWRAMLAAAPSAPATVQGVNQQLLEALEYFVSRKAAILAKFDIHGPADIAAGMRIKLGQAEAAIAAARQEVKP